MRGGARRGAASQREPRPQQRGLEAPPGALPSGWRKLEVRLRPSASGLQVGMDKWPWIPETPKGSHLRLDRCSETPDVTPSPSRQVPGVRACVLTEPVRDSVQGVLQASLVGCFSPRLLLLEPTRFEGLLRELYMRGLGLRLITGLLSGNFTHKPHNK